MVPKYTYIHQVHCSLNYTILVSNHNSTTYLFRYTE